MVWPVQFLGDNVPNLPSEYEDESFDKAAIWDAAFRQGAEYLSNYLAEYYSTLTDGKVSARYQKFYERADWVNDLFNTPEPQPEEK